MAKPTEPVDRNLKGIKKKTNKAVTKKNKILERLVVEYIKVNSVKPNTYNPNRQSEHDFELLLKSIREDGFTQPVVVHKETMEIVDGEHRWRAAQALGMTEMPVVFVNMTAEQMRIATLRHNRARGSEDIELSAQIIRDLNTLGALEWAQDSLLLDNVEVDKLLNDVSAPELFAGKTFNQAWEPTDEVDASAYKALPNNNAITSTSESASQELRTQETKLKAARNQEEKEQIRKESDVFKLELIYSGEEAAVVKEALGTQNPAKVLLEICQSQVGTHIRQKLKKPKTK